jgi:signal transduction histidine kinase
MSHLKRLSNDPAVHVEVDRLVDLSSATSRQIAQLARDLRPSVLDDLGLVAALRSCTHEMSERVGVPVELSVLGSVPRLSRDAETAVFRVVQEALTNVAKHAGARAVRVDLSADADVLRFSVSDDGRGFDPSAVEARTGESGPSGLGLTGIRERVQLLDGSVEISSRPGLGTCVAATVPIGPAESIEEAA